ncbi:MAG TPA: hypothetical protein VK325_01025, partial [Pseudoxanthomonas sp.]|nr:hypothetical protein [Pseudoxanthomonas sp.]
MAGTADAAPTLRRTSLSRRLVGRLLLLTLLVSAAVTAIQLASDYRRNAILLRELVTERVGSIADVLGASIWNVDEAGVRMLLHGLNHDPGVARVELRTLDGERFSVGGPPELALATLRFDLTHASTGGRTVGSLWVTLDGAEVRERAFGRLQAIVLTTLAVVLSGCLAIFLLVRRLVVRHLERIADYARKLDLSGLDRALVLERRASVRPDELDLVVEGFDRMRSRLAEEVAIQQ